MEVLAMKLIDVALTARTEGRMNRIPFKRVGVRFRHALFACRVCDRRATLCGYRRCYSWNCRHCSKTGKCQGCQRPLPGYGT